MEKKATIYSIAIILYALSSCTPSIHNQYYKKIQGTWAINDFQYRDEFEDEIIDLRKERYYSIGFSNNNHLWFTKVENRRNVSIRATYEIFKQNDTLKLRIDKSDDVRLEGVYDLYIDTLGETSMHYRVQLSLDSENTYLSSLRMKSKPAPKIAQ